MRQLRDGRASIVCTVRILLSKGEDKEEDRAEGTGATAGAGTESGRTAYKQAQKAKSAVRGVRLERQRRV